MNNLDARAEPIADSDDAFLPAKRFSNPVGCRITDLGFERLKFWAALQNKSPTTAANELLDDAIRRALHESTAA